MSTKPVTKIKTQTGPHFFAALRQHIVSTARPNHQILLGTVLVGLTDFLLVWNEPNWGSLARTLVLLSIAFAGIISASDRLFSKNRIPKNWALGSAVLAIGFLPVFENGNFLSTIIALFALAISLLLFNWQTSANSDHLTIAFGKFWYRFCGRWFRDLILRSRARRIKPSKTDKQNLAINWLLPAMLALVFIIAFAFANPLIGNWFSAIDFEWLLSLINPWRIAFWLSILVFVWPFIRPRIHRHKRFKRIPKNKTKIRKSGKRNSASQIENDGYIHYFTLQSDQARRALILFNVLFAVQTVMDIIYLWFGGQLPAGVTYSEYVHNGTYILLCTTLMAAAFILYITSKRKKLEQNAGVRILLYLWLGQNAFMVLSVLKRLELYIDAYSLTYLRVAAFIWIILVMIGLALIAFRLKTDKTNFWLIKANLGALAVIFYATALVNWPSTIASYNIAAEEKRKGNLSSLDINYICSLGPQVIPNLTYVADRLSKDGRRHKSQQAVSAIKILKTQTRKTQQDWRAWTFRHHRLVHYLRTENSTAAHPNPD